MTDFIAARKGIPFQLDGEKMRFDVHRNGGLEFHGRGQSCWYPKFGEFIYDEWEMVRPYPTDAFNDEIDPDVVAVLVKRPKRYLTALAARAFIKEMDLHEEPGPVGLRSLFRSMGGTVIQPGGISDRDADRFPGRTARLHGRGDITLFLQEGEDQIRRRELMALTIALEELQREHYEDGYAHGPLDVSFDDPRRTHPEAHLFASMILVPRDPNAPRSIDVATAEEIGAELKVDPATVQDGYQLWHEITHPEQPKL
ncbi:MAG TPA: hypothetical protein VF885_13165 [Arthrobacter sp.]